MIYFFNFKIVYADDAICLHCSIKSFYLFSLNICARQCKQTSINHAWQFSHVRHNIFTVIFILPITTNYVYMHTLYELWIWIRLFVFIHITHNLKTNHHNKVHNTLWEKRNTLIPDNTFCMNILVIHYSNIFKLKHYNIVII